MVERKSISINPAFLNIKSRKKKTLKKQKKEKPSIKPNTIKRDLINKVKNYQKKIKENKKTEKKSEIPKFEDEFNDSLDYLQSLVKKKREKKNKKNKSNHNLINSSVENEALNTSENLTIKLTNTNIKDDVPYGILKNGKKPTYRQYFKKNTSLKNIEPLKLETNIESLTQFEPRKENLSNFKQNFLIKHSPSHTIEKINEEKSILKKIPSKYIKKRKIKTKRKLGKCGNIIGILVKNNRTRKKIETDHELLKTSTLKEVKQHLRKQGLLKIGSSAPPDILRKIYEDSFLTGDVYNKNSGVLIHNYLNEEEDE